MKFGLNYHNHMLPKWVKHYIDYNGLRAQIRAADKGNDAVLQECFEIFQRSRLQSSIESVESFLSQKQAWLRDLGHQYRTRFDLPFKAQDWLEKRKLCESELLFFQQYYEDSLCHIRDLQSFRAVNEMAILRLFDKFIATGADQFPEWQSTKKRWLYEQEALKGSLYDQESRASECICAIRESLGHPRDGATWSLGMWVMIQHQFPTGMPDRQVYELVKNEDTTMLTQMLETIVFEQMVQKFGEPGLELGARHSDMIGDLLILAMLIRSDNATTLLLSTILKQNLTISTDQVAIILALWRTRKEDKTFSTHLAQMLCGTPTISSLTPDYYTLPRPVIHSAAQYGYIELLETFIKQIDETKGQAMEAILFEDNDYKTTLHCALLSGQTNVFLSMLSFITQKDKSASQELRVLSLYGDLLLLSVRVNNMEVVRVLLSSTFTDLDTNSALHAASQNGNLEMVKLIVQYVSKTGGHLNKKTRVRGWTALMAACANGHENVVTCLLDARADPSLTDARGWTAQEHAAFRGHLSISDLPTLVATRESSSGPAGLRQVAERMAIDTLLPSQKAIIVNLGSVQGSHQRPTLRLPEIGPRDSHSPGQPGDLVLELSMPQQKSYLVPVPLLRDYTNAPFVFLVEKETLPQIILRLYRWGSSQNKLLSGGTVILDQDNAKFGTQRESMLRETTVFMVEPLTMEAKGTVLLSYVVANGFAGLQSSQPPSYWRQPGKPPRLVGHRGLGQNTASQSSLQLGENTAMSFLSAAKLGASFIEFDLQLTRDLEAVIFHDFSLSELGADVPIHDVTLAQYKHVSSLQGPQQAAIAVLTGGVEAAIEPRQRQRTFSTGEESVLRSSQLKERLLYTVDFQNKGFKPNTRGHSIQDTLATLDELLVELPEDIGFNIEMKYPRLHEAIEAGVAPVAIDINTFVDTALRKIERLAGRRPIILSSFTPEMCILLSLKQKTYPVMFITNAGKVPMADKERRAESLQMGIHFARRWNLAGIVLACETFLHCPRFIKFVQNAGLVCASYGLPNNDPACVRVQADAGIDIIIADKVKLIAYELNKDVAK